MTLDDPYLPERVRAHLAQDPRTGALGLVVRVASGRIFITGSVPSERCREAVSEVAAELDSAAVVVNETTVTPAADPGEHQELLQ